MPYTHFACSSTLVFSVFLYELWGSDEAFKFKFLDPKEYRHELYIG